MKHKKGLIILIIIAAISMILGAKSIISKLSDKGTFSFKISSTNQNEDFEEDFDEDFDDESSDTLSKILSLKLGKDFDEAPKNTNKPYISVIYISGVISAENKTYNQKWLLKQIKRAKNDSKNRGILVNIDSPGGTVYESDEAYLALMDYKKATGRPVFAYFGSLAASGGYYIACGADYIYANRNTLTGSIGVIAGQSIDATALLDKLGIKMTTITAGKNKNMGNYNSVLTEEQRSILQSIADEAYEQFTEIVADSRKMNISDVKKLADGRIYTANQAHKNGLVDKVCSLEDAKSDIKTYLSEKDENAKDEQINFVEYKYRYGENWISLFSEASSLIKNPEASIYGLLGNTSSKCLYLYE
ncbi:signal peptide peptidase SppA [uncultured Treponema sp.]|uniref:signal peptide peptidase SppA n=1 Tax=uncultured Treponema sp. TaxID=162155 RepID=UPI0025F6EB72|nr:signal peptide peptidase SppA [uncultured Treponema sp.]